MNILLTFDNNYSEHAAVVIASLLLYNKGSQDFYIVSDYISEENRAKLRTTALNSKVHFIIIEKSKFKDLPIGKGTANTYVTIATYYRLIAIDLLPKRLDKVLYLDSDITINGDITGLYYSTFPEGIFIKVLEETPSLAKEGTLRLEYPSEYSYFNAGVILFNMSKVREYYSFNKAKEYAKNHIIKFHDQDILNGLFYDKKEFFQLKYNVMESALIKNAPIAERYLEQKDAIYNPAIIHFSGHLKPWQKECKNPYKYKYLSALSMTPWKDSKLQNRFSKRKDKNIFKIKNLIKRILELLHIRYYSFVDIKTSQN